MNIILIGILVVYSFRLSEGFQCLISDNNLRLDCFPQNGATKDLCLSRGCCWNPPTTSKSPSSVHGEADVPYCYYPVDYSNYQVQSVKSTPRGQEVLLQRHSRSYLPQEILTLLMEVIYETNTRVRVRITDPKTKRFEVPVEVAPADKQVPQNPEYIVAIPPNGSFAFEIIRKFDGQVMFNAVGPLLYSEQFIQISTVMATDKIYGIGEQNREFLHNLSSGWSRLGLWARDNGIETNINLYGTHPFYMGMPSNGRAFGTYFFNSNAQEFGLQPAPLITYRTTGGILDMFFFTGGTPKDTVSQFLDLIGRPMLPPFWSLGFHLCRYGYKGTSDIANVFLRNVNAGIPIGAQWSDIDYMDKYKDFTIDSTNFKGLGALVKTLKQKYGAKFVVIIDPAIYDLMPGSYPAYDDGLQMDVFVKHSLSKQPLKGKVWPGETVFPDFTHPNATEYWTKQIQRFYSLAPIDGLWIDMNEPSNFVDGSTIGCPGNSQYDSPFFTPIIRDNSLLKKTICSSALHYNNVLHYNLHNLYGYTESVVTNSALQTLKPNERVFMLSRSTFSGSGKYTNHWTGDNFSSWDQLAHSIRQILNFNMFGIPMVGADICGFNGPSNEELCIRWTQLGAFYPFMRNHNSVNQPDQDPASWSPAAIQVMKISIEMRYALLPNFYTLFVKAHLNGTTVFRPLGFEFFSDPQAHAIENQFMIGSMLLVTPVVTQGATSVTGYFPAGVWYDISEGNPVRSGNVGGWISLEAPLNKINVALRGGKILTILDPKMTLDELRKGNLTFYCGMSLESEATGDLYWDDGLSLDSFSGNKYSYFTFSADINGFYLTPRKTFYKVLPWISRLVVIGLQKSSVSKVTVNGTPHPFVFRKDYGLLLIEGIQSPIWNNFVVKWS